MSDEIPELVIPWKKPVFVTPKGQSFEPQTLPGVEATPYGLMKEADNRRTDRIREEIGREMNKETLLCPIDKFLEHYGPVPGIDAKDVVKCKKYLVKSGTLRQVPGTTKYRWKEFEANPSQYQENTEQRVFEDLKPIIDEIFKYAGTQGQGRGNDYKFEMVPHNYLQAEVAGTGHKMDGCMVDPEYKTGKLPVRSIILPHEYKKKRTEEDQRWVRLQAVGDCQHIMCEDPRRIFIYAITIEDTRMSVWYFSRSHSMKALSFDWVETDIDTFIHVFLAFAYATPEQLGVDPTVHLAPRDPDAEPGTNASAQHYIYQCPIEEDTKDLQDTVRRSARLKEPKFKYFKTVHIIKEMRPYNISGRNTRVWKVVEVKGPDTNDTVTGEELVLKDVWLDVSRPTEAENMDSIFKEVDELIENSKAVWGDDWKDRLVAEDKRFAQLDAATKQQLQHFLTDQNYKSLFLTKIHAWKGAQSKEVLPNLAFNSARGVKIFPEATEIEKPIPSHTARTNYSQSAFTAASKTEPIVRRQYAPKQQSRFIYKEVCSDLDTVGTLGNLMDLVNQALDALRILFCAGWVHRDISSNNLLAFDDNGKWKIKLSDLEFSQTLTHISNRSDPKTGTPYFMPIEIMTRRYLLRHLSAPRNAKPTSTLAKQLKLEEGSTQYERLKAFKKIGDYESLPSDADLDSIPGSRSTVRYNFQHDLESIWWIVFYFIMARVPHKPSQNMAKEIFQPNLVASPERLACLQDVIDEDLEEILHPSLKDTFPAFIETLRGAMFEEYQIRAVFGQLQLSYAYTGIHATFANEFAGLLADNQNNWKNIPILSSSSLQSTKAVVQTIAGTKRGRDEDDSEDEDSVNKKHRQDDD